MQLFPAIDILNGKAVRLYKGNYSQVTTYNDNPLDVAQTFKSRGCTAVHLVDLDGAKEGRPINLKIVETIAQIPDLYTEIGGGIRNLATIDAYLSAGVSRVILGTAALNDPKFLQEALSKYQDKIAVGVDLNNGLVAVKGWVETTQKDGLEFLKELQDQGVQAAIVTDISKDGAMKGTNLSLYKKIQQTVNMKITASGGISSLEDLKALKKINIHAAIIGKAYYTGAIKLEQALEVAT